MGVIGEHQDVFHGTVQEIFNISKETTMNKKLYL